MQETQKMQVQSLGREDPLEKEMATDSSILENSHGQRSLVGYSPYGGKELWHRHSWATTYMPTPGDLMNAKISEPD